MYNSTKKKNPTPEELRADMRKIAQRFSLYMKDADPFSDYFADKIRTIRSSYNVYGSKVYYYANRLESLAYRHERAKRHYATNKLTKVA